MNRVERINERAEEGTGAGADSESGQPAPDDVEVPPMIQKAVEKHRADLAGLMKRHAYRWAAYRGDHRLEIGTSKHRLYRKYLDSGLSLDELVVLGIGPPIPDEIDGEEWLDG